MEKPIINPALSLLININLLVSAKKLIISRLFIGQVSIDQHFVTTRVVHLPKRTETSLITESDRSGPNHRIGPGCTGRAQLQ